MSVNTWVEMPPMLFARRGAASGTIGGRLYVCGGCVENFEWLSSVERFDPVAGSAWQAMPSMPQPRAGATVRGRPAARPRIPVAPAGVEILFPPRDGVRLARILAPRLFLCGGVGASEQTCVES